MTSWLLCDLKRVGGRSSFKKESVLFWQPFGNDLASHYSPVFNDMQYLRVFGKPELILVMAYC